MDGRVLDTALLGASSSYLQTFFKTKNRDNEHCPICHEDFDAPEGLQRRVIALNNRGSPDCICAVGVTGCIGALYRYRDQTLCTVCGWKFHRSCVDSWRRAAINLVARNRCALCRSRWNPSSTLLFPPLDQQALKAYFDFIMRGSALVCGPQDEILSMLVRCYETGFCFLNRSFCIAVMAAVLETCNKLGDIPRARELKLVYGKLSESKALRRLVVEIWVRWSDKALRHLKEGLKEGLGDRRETVPDGLLLDLRAVEYRGDMKKCHIMPVPRTLEVNQILVDLLEVLDEDFAKAARKDAETGDKEVHTLTIDMAGTVMAPPP